MKKKGYVFLILTIVFLLGAIFLYNKSNDLKTIRLNYQENQKIGYKVYLTDESYYGKEYLDEGMQYISSIVDNIDVDFKYNLNFDQKIDYTIDSNVVANIKFVDINDESKVIYSSQENLGEESITKKNSEVLEITKNLKVDYMKYNKIANEFKSSYGVSANCKLIIDFYVNYSGVYGEDDLISGGSVGKIEIPLSKQMINLNKSNDITNNSYYEFANDDLSEVKTWLISSVCVALLSIIMLILFIRELVMANKNKNKYESHINKILRQYDSYITESKSTVKEDGKTVIKCSSFKELMDVRSNIEKAIIYVRVSKYVSKFMLIDNNEIYLYQVSTNDFKD